MPALRLPADRSTPGQRISLEVGSLQRADDNVKAYFVRKADNREVVGLFVAPSVVVLAALVDECCDPNICEYAVAQAGGLIVPDVAASKWPLGQDSSAGAPKTGLEDAILSQQWQDDLTQGDSGLEWKPLTAAARAMILALGPRTTH